MGVADAKSKLNKYVYLEMEYNNNKDRLARLENDRELPAMQEGDGSQRSLLKTSRMENAAIRKMMQEKRITQRLEAICDELAEIEDAVDMLTDPMQKEVIRLRYMDCEYCKHTRWNDVAKSIYGDDEEKHLLAIWRIHSHALLELEKIFSEQEKNAS